MTLPLLTPYKLNTWQYHSMLDHGILMKDDKVELLNGEIIEMSPIGSKHSATVSKINSLLSVILQGQLICRIQDPIQLGPYSEPEPDIALVKARDDFYSKAHPEAKDVLLIIEVADTSLEVDREVKAEIYAEAGIRVYWIINLRDNLLEVHKEPFQSGYKNIRLFELHEKLNFDLTEKEIMVSDLFV
jgi:Uma2 family endonuclease